MNEWEQCINGWSERNVKLQQQLADAQAVVESLQGQFVAAKKVKADYDRWLSGGVYFTTADYEKHVAEQQRQVEALLRERDELQVQLRLSRFNQANAEAAQNGLQAKIRALTQQLDAERDRLREALEQVVYHFPQRGDGMKPLIQELETLLGGYSEENESNTPDFILAKFVLACLENFNAATRARDRWYGVHLAPGDKYFKNDEEA